MATKFSFQNMNTLKFTVPRSATHLYANIDYVIFEHKSIIFIGALIVRRAVGPCSSVGKSKTMLRMFGFDSRNNS